MIVSADLFGLLTTQADLNYYTQQLEIISEKYESNVEKLSEQQKYEEIYEEALDDAENPTKALKAGGRTWTNKVDDNYVFINPTDEGYRAYAHAKSPKYDAAILEELTDKDMAYESIKTSLEAMIEVLKAQKDAEKQNTANAAADTCLITQ